METSNMEFTIINGTADRIRTNKQTGASTYKAHLAVKGTEEQLKAFAEYGEEEAKNFEWSDSLGKYRIFEITINAGIGYSVWNEFLSHFLTRVNKRISRTNAYNFIGFKL